MKIRPVAASSHRKKYECAVRQAERELAHVQSHGTLRRRPPPKPTGFDGARMRITCTSSDAGNVYRFFNDAQGFRQELTPLIPLVLDSGAEVQLGEPASGAQLVITFGPKLAQVEREFLALARPHLERPKRARA